MGDFSPWHLAIIAVVFVLLFGAKRLPDGARSLGRSLRIFKSEIKSMGDDDEKPADTQVHQQLPAPLPAAPPVVTPTAEQPTVSATTAPTGQPPAQH